MNEEIAAIGPCRYCDGDFIACENGPMCCDLCLGGGHHGPRPARRLCEHRWLDASKLADLYDRREVCTGCGIQRWSPR